MPENKSFFTVILVLSVLFILGVIVLGGSTNLLQSITGKLSTTNVTLNIANIAPISGNLSFIGAVNIVESTQNPILFSFTATDGDGAEQLNDSTIELNFTLRYSGWSEVVRTNVTSCNRTNISVYTMNFSCVISIWYYDAPAIWNVSFSVRDISNSGFVNVTGNFTIQATTGIDIAPGNITFPAINARDTNRTATEPINITNTANYNISTNNSRITAVDLAGLTAPSYKIFSDNFTGSTATGGSGQNLIQCERTSGNGTSIPLVNGSIVSIPGSIITRGNHTIGEGGNETFYICLTRVGSNLTQQAYSTTGTQAWTISVV